MSVLGLLNGVVACTDLTTKPWVIKSGVEVINKPFNAQGNIAIAGGCLAAQYLATWVIYKLAGKQQAEAAIHYASPISEKAQYVNHCINVVEQYI